MAEWELAETGSADEWRNNYQKVEQYMTTDLFTVQEDEPIDLVVNLMDWNKIRHIPVEDNNNRLVGIISYRTLLRMVARGWRGESNRPIPVSEIMKKELVTVAPETLTLDAIEMMQRNKVSCLPVVRDGYLVGIVTERDFIKVTADLLKQKLQEENQKETKTQKYKEAKTL